MLSQPQVIRRRRIGSVAVVLALLLAAVACSDDAEPSGVNEPAAEETPTTETPTTVAPVVPEWVMHEADDDCVCADGSDFVFFSRTNDPQKVVLYFQGGGACFTAETCALVGGTYKVTTGPGDDPSAAGGIFDFDDARNPFRDWSVVFVPYCTGDVHIGDATTEYSPELTIEHNGMVNAAQGLDFLVDEFPDATDVFVTGSSAGGVPSPLFGGLVSDELPDAEVAVLADASGGYSSSSGINAVIGQLWGAYDAAPDWPEIAARPAADYGIPDLFVVAGEHAPGVRMARYDNAFDSVQRRFSALAGASGEGLLPVLDQNEALVEDSGTDLSVYVAPGEQHTILLRPDLYDLSVDGASFLDWLTSFVEGDDPGDVRCVDCGAPEPAS